MSRSSLLLSLVEADFEYRQLNDLLNTVKKLEAGEYDLSSVETIFTASSNKVDLDSIQKFITQYRGVCYLKLEGYSDNAKDLILLSNEPRKVGESKLMKDLGVITCKNSLFAYNLE